MSEQTDDFLEHYGVKGMRWGRRRTDAQLDAAKSKRKSSKPSSSDIKDARARQWNRLGQLDKAETAFFVSSTKKGKAEAQAMVTKLEAELYYGKDVATAAKMTKGEKWANGVAWGGLALSAVSYAAIVTNANR